MFFLGGDLGCFVLRILRSLSRSSKPTLQEHYYHCHVQQKIKTCGFLILGFGFDDAVLYNKVGASVIRSQ